jgi:hypothetical protein
MITTDIIAEERPRKAAVARQPIAGRKETDLVIA